MSNQATSDLQYLTLFPKRYEGVPNLPTKTYAKGRYWRKVIRKYDDHTKWIERHVERWYVITYVDGHKELAFLRTLQLGISPAIYRGLIPRLLSFTQYANIKNIRLAF